MKIQLDRIGIIGIVLTAFLSPCCFPLFGFALTAMGLGSFELFGGWTMWIFQGLVLVSLIGFYISYRQHRCMYPLTIAIPSALLIFYFYYFNNSEHWTTLLYIGMFGLFGATVWNFYRVRLHKKEEPKLNSIITCPHCGHKKEEIMPTDSCQFFYECENCKQVIKPKQGDCCVYCSYGTVKCPSIQLGKACC